MKRLTKEEILSIPDKLANGLTYEEVGRELGFKKVTIQKAVYRLRKAGVEVLTIKGRRAVKLT